MNRYFAHAYEAERERTWTNRHGLSALVGSEAVGRSATRRFQRSLAVLIIAGTTMFGAHGPVTGSAHTSSPCFGRSTTHQMSFGQPTTIRHRAIPDLFLQRLYCRLLPSDPLNQNLAVVIRNNG
jgi:hypothetical protein